MKGVPKAGTLIPLAGGIGETGCLPSLKEDSRLFESFPQGSDDKGAGWWPFQRSAEPIPSLSLGRIPWEWTDVFRSIALLDTASWEDVCPGYEASSVTSLQKEDLQSL